MLDVTKWYLNSLFIAHVVVVLDPPFCTACVVARCSSSPSFEFAVQPPAQYIIYHCTVTCSLS